MTAGDLCMVTTDPSNINELAPTLMGGDQGDPVPTARHILYCTVDRSANYDLVERAEIAPKFAENYA